ncbi:hypothetical protein ACWD1Y_00280 [Streptomyces sp. NPDC002814]
MRERTAQVIESLLLALIRALLPAHGRHRATSVQPPDTDLPLAAHPTRPHALDVHPFAYDTPLVRPYLHGAEMSA